jgi:hypothetical protein
MSRGRIGERETIVDKQDRKAIGLNILSFDIDVLILATT